MTFQLWRSQKATVVSLITYVLTTALRLGNGLETGWSPTAVRT